MNDKIQNFKDFLIKKGVNEIEIAPFLADIQKEIKNKKYGLVWEDKDEDVSKELVNKFPLFNEYISKDIMTDNNKPTNLLIEGDNLYTLKALQYTHKGSCHVIYIDPPYNIGNSDFMYNGKYVDKEDTWRHSKWLSFMNKRLRLAKNLLTDDGLIFISIGDNEHAQLKLLCNEIFGEANFLANINRTQSKGAKNDTKNFVNDNDYILAYCKNISYVQVNKVTTKNDTSKYNKVDNIGKYKRRAFEMQGGDDTLVLRPKMGYSVYYNENTKDIKALLDYDLNRGDVYEKPNKELIKSGYICFRPKETKNGHGIWRWGMETFLENKSEIEFDTKACRLYIKEREKEELSLIPNCNIEAINTEATKEILNLFGQKVFLHSKPLKLIKWIVDRHPNKNAVILDFFAGSGTTGHAVLELNKEDGGNRKFILCTHNENNLCEDITYQRINKAICGYTALKGIEVDGLGGNLKYYRVMLEDDKIDIDDNINNLIYKCSDTITIKEQCFELIERNSTYDIISNTEKVVLLYKNPFAMDYEVEEVSKTLSNYKQVTKMLYTTNTDVQLEGIVVKEFPVEMINHYKVLNVV